MVRLPGADLLLQWSSDSPTEYATDRPNFAAERPVAPFCCYRWNKRSFRQERNEAGPATGQNRRRLRQGSRAWRQDGARL